MISRAFAVDLATAASTMMTIGIAILAFLADRTRARSRTQLGSYTASLSGLVLLAIYTAASDGIAWWAWTRAGAADLELLFKWKLSTWLFVLFLPPLLFCGCVFGVSAMVIARQVRRYHREHWRP
jgi:MFS family permease